MEKISFIMPVYNAADTVAISIENILRQTYKNFELLIIDDLSTDDTGSICAFYAKQDERIRLLHLKKNGGVSHARNVGIEASRGEWLFFIDSDDLLDEDAIEKMLDYAKTYKVNVVEARRCFWWNDKGELRSFNDIGGKVKKNHVLNMKDMLLKPRYVTGKLYHRDVIADIRFDELLRCYEDTLFNHQIKRNIEGYLVLADVRYHYLQHRDSLVHSINQNHLLYPYVARKIKESYLDFAPEYHRDIDLLINEDIIVILSKLSLGTVAKALQYPAVLEMLRSVADNQRSLSQALVLKCFGFKGFYRVYSVLIKPVPLTRISFRFLSLFYNDIVYDEKILADIRKALNHS